MSEYTKLQKYLRTIYVHLTRLCNLSCVYCYMDAGECCQDELNKEMSTHDLKRILTEIIDYKPEKIVFTGGEPLTRCDLLELAAYLRKLDKDHSIHLCLDSNGTLVTQQITAALVEMFDEIRISIDGFQRINDVLRGKGTFEAALRAIGEIHHAGGDPSLAITATSINKAELASFINYMCYEWGIKVVRINPLRRIGRALGRHDLLPDYNDGLSCAVGLQAGNGDKEPCNGDFSCIGTSLSISPQGLIFPCHWLAQEKYCIGDARAETMALIYDRLCQMRNILLVRA